MAWKGKYEVKIDWGMIQAIIAIPNTKPRDPDASGLLHIAFTFGSLQDLALAYLQRKENGILPYWCVNHGPTTSMYYKDPDGNDVGPRFLSSSIPPPSPLPSLPLFPQPFPTPISHPPKIPTFFQSAKEPAKLTQNPDRNTSGEFRHLRRVQ